MNGSIIIPAYNEERYLPHCLSTLMAEIRRNPQHQFEVIVVDNASTDKTATIAKSYDGVKLVTESNKGLVRARQAGFLAATGDILVNIDADTMVPAGWLGQLVNEFETNPNLVALSGPQRHYDLPTYLTICVRIFYGLGYLVYLMNRFVFQISSLVQGGNFVIKRSVLEAIGGYNTTEFDFYGEDADLARRLFQVGDVKFTPHFFIYASGRRLVGEGILTMGLRYAINYLWVVIFKKPFNHTYSDIRIPALPSTKEFITQRLLRRFARFFGNVEPQIFTQHQTRLRLNSRKGSKYNHGNWQ